MNSESNPLVSPWFWVTAALGYGSGLLLLGWLAGLGAVMVLAGFFFRRRPMWQAGLGLVAGLAALLLRYGGWPTM